MSDVVLKVEGLSKKFCKSLKRSMLYGTHDVARDMFGIPQKQVELRKAEFWALQDINFELKRGETLGLIGQNGCGKSTLLRLINGIYPPDKGNITINGRIGALIAVGAGFHPHMTGRENIFLNGTILGMSKAELKQKFDAIVDFAELGDFIDSPVATYSSGMTVRLGFAIAIHCEPDILLLDEILAVGDFDFQKKCNSRINNLRNNGVTTILVTHSITNIIAMCSRVILMDNSQIISDGNTIETVNLYQDRQNHRASHKLIPEFESIKIKSYFIWQDGQKALYDNGSFIIDPIKDFDIFLNIELKEEIVLPEYSLDIYKDEIRLCSLDLFNVDNPNDIPLKLNLENFIKFSLKTPKFYPGKYKLYLTLKPKDAVYFNVSNSYIGSFVIKIPNYSSERYINIYNYIDQSSEVHFLEKVTFNKM